MVDRRFAKVIFIVTLLLIPCWKASGTVAVIDRLATDVKNDFYVGNRPPLMPSPFMKLPIGSIKPHGWLRRQLQLQADGFSGNLTEISEFLRKGDNAWLSPKGEGQHPWEETPYWLKGFGDTGYVLGDERIIKEARLWIEGILSSQREDGYFGPRANLNVNGKPDLWPNMVALFALQSYYEYSGDKRVPDLMINYFHWQMTVPESDFLIPFWQQQRAGDNLYSVYWLYNRTGENWLLDLAQKIHKHTARWTEGVASWHGVNIAQCFREPAIFYQQSKAHKYLHATERNYQMVKDMYGQVPGGLYGADENCRPGYTDPRQATETCSMVEMMLSHELMLEITGDPKWADRCEEVAFNSFPAAMTADLKALRYLTAPNLIRSDRQSKSPGLQNGGPMLLMNPHDHRCCQHNVAHGWPYYAESLWMATPDNGIAAVLYAPSEVTAKVGNGTKVTITEKTRYPFDENIELTISTPNPVQFPLFLRVPSWSSQPKLKINGKQVEVEAKPLSFIKIDRKWTNGDTINLYLPMKVTITKWTTNKNSVSVNLGPLTFSLKIGEKYVRAGGTDKWPAWEINPTTPWNYGLALREDEPAASFEVVRKEWPQSDQPFETDAAPVQLRVKAKKIPAWKEDELGLVGTLQTSPVKSDQPIETVTLIPMGCARLRISSFPTIGEGKDANEWFAPRISARASHCWSGDTVSALNDGMLPKNSNDHDIPRMTWWEHKGTDEWVQYEFSEPEEVSFVEIYWFDDQPIGGGCRVPKSWRVMYKVGEEFKPVRNSTPYDVKKDGFDKAIFEPVTTTALRVEVVLQDGFSGGILEWRFGR